MTTTLLKRLITSLLILISGVAQAQDIIEVLTQVVPPYTSNFSNFHTKTLVTLRNTTGQLQEMNLEGTLTGDNGVTVSFPNTLQSPIIVNSQQVIQLNAGQLMPYFTENNVTTKGITKDELYRGDGLPPGSYQLCLRARSVITGGLLSMGPPQGCADFRIEDEVNENAVRLTTQVIPPYSTYLSDYFNQNKVLVTLQNLAGRTIELRLTGAIESDNGVALRVPDTYILNNPIRLEPRQVIQLTGSILKPYFDENRLEIKGINKNDLLRGNGLPEGNYQLCLQAVEYTSGEPLSPGEPAGCAMFDIRQFEPPMIIQPLCETQVRVLKPQNMLFSWSVPAGVRPDQVEYILKIVEMYPPSVDPNQAMMAANAPPFFEKVVRTNSYIYTIADPVLEEGKKYAFRVTARSNTQTSRRASPFNFRNDGHSAVCYFTYGNEISDNELRGSDVLQQEWSLTYESIQRINIDPGDVLTTPIPTDSMSPDPEDSQDCIAGCNVPAPTNTSPISIAPGDEVQIGKFTMTIATGNNTSGTGTINVNFLRTPINVSFENLQVNTDYQAFGSSKVTAIPDGALAPDRPYVLGILPNPQINETDFDFIMQMAGQNARKVSLFPTNNEQGIGTPVVLDYGNFDLIVIGLIFTPTSASMNAITSVELMNSTNTDDFLVLSTSMCVRPNGLGEQGEVALMQNKQVPLSSHVSMIFNESTTRATFNCQGINELELNGSLRFDRNVVLPVNNNGDVVNGEVTATFNTSIDDYNDWTIAVNSLSSPFTVPPLIGFKFEASDIAFDHSSSQNVSGMGNAFPSGYPGANNSWTGLYIGDLSVTLPQSLKNNNSPISFTVSDVLLDKNGFSADIDPQVAILPSGKLGGWNFSIDGFSLMVENSALNGTGMNGGIQLPISQNELQYAVAIVESASEDDEVDFNFQMSTNQSVNVDMWFAELDLAPTSTIGIGKEGNSYRPKADLSGELTIQWSPNSENKPGNGTNNVSGVNLPELSFEHFIIEGGSQPSIDIQYVALDNYDNDQAVLARFPLGLNQLAVNKQGNQVALQLGLDLTLTPGGNGISAGTTFSILGDFTNGYYDYNSTQLNSIHIDTDLGVAQILGDIDIYNQHPVYGDGFRGQLSATINAINLGFDATMQIGKTLGNNGYRYWYFDLLFDMGPTGLPIPGTAAAIYSIGGGAYHNMYRDPMPKDMLSDAFVDDPPYNNTPGSTVYGNDIVPQQGSFGFNASMGFGLAGSPNALNGDVKFSMQLTENGGINNVKIEGGGYLMQSFGDRSEAFISGSLAITIAPYNPAYPNTTPMFHLETPNPFSMNVANLLTADIPIGLHFDPQTWYLKFGEWQNWQEPWNDGARAQMGVDLKIYEALFNGYFMMGNEIPGIPPLPLEVQQKFGMNETTDTPRSGILGVNTSGGGIAFGAGYRLEVGDPRLKFLIFYADVDFSVGFDVTLKHYGNDTPCGNNFGINNWYANGQMYAMADFDVGMEIDVWIFKGKLSLVKASAAATLQAALPNPNWIKGQFYINGKVLNDLIKVSTDFKFELGEKCMPNSGNPFDDMPIIADINPFDGENKVSVFTDPEIAFNFPNEEFTVEEVKGNGSTEVRTYYYTFESYKITFKNDDNTNKTMDLTNWKRYRSNGLSAVFVSSDILPPKRAVNYEIKVKGWEKVPGPDKLLTTETKTGTFHTAQFPDYIAADHFISSTPGYRQRYFLKNEWPKGTMKLKYDYSTLFDPEFWYEEQWKLGNYVNAATTGTFEWKMRYKELATNEIKERACTISEDGTLLSFNIPNGLSNEEIYSLDLRVIFHPRPNTLAAGSQDGSNTYDAYKNVLISGNGGSGSETIGSMTSNPSSGNSGGGSSPSNTGKTAMQTNNAGTQTSTMNLNTQQMLTGNYQTVQQVNPGNNVLNQYQKKNAVYETSLGMGILQNPGGGGTSGGVSIQRMNRQLLESKESAKTVEQSLLKFKFPFRTSKFNTIHQKLNQTFSVYANEVSSTMPIGAFYNIYPEGDIFTEVPVVLIELKENFDHYQIFGYHWGTSINGGFIEPVYKISHGYNQNWFDTFAEDLYYMPDEIDWHGYTFYDEYNEPIIDYEPPLPNWDDYLPKYYDWYENRHDGKWPFGDRNYAIPMELSLDEPTYEFYNKNKHGIISWNGKNVVQPDGKLTNAEVNQAASEAPDPPGTLSPQFQVEVYTPPTLDNQAYTQIPGKKYMAIIDYAEWVSMRDYRIFKNFIHERNVDLLGGPLGGQNTDEEYYGTYFLPIESYLNLDMYYKNRPGPLQLEFNIKNRNYIYQAPELNEDFK